MIVLRNAKVEHEAKTLMIHCKVSDRFTASLLDKDGNEIHVQEDGYVPGFMPGDHYGDYVILEIDLDSGRIVNWKHPDANDLEEWINAA